MSRSPVQATQSVQTCIFPAPLAANPSTDQKIEHVRAVETYLSCKYKSIALHLQHVAMETEKYEAVLNGAPAPLSRYVREAYDLFHITLQNELALRTRSAHRYLMELPIVNRDNYGGSDSE